MELSQIVRSIIRDPSDIAGTRTVQVTPDREVVLDVEELGRLRTQFVREVGRIPNIEDGLSWKLIQPYVRNNGFEAQAVIGIGDVLGLWKVFPSPASSPEMYRMQGTMFPSSSPVEVWPDWSGVESVPDGDPKIAGEAPVPMDLGVAQEELDEYLKQFG